jgi:hypothetical protein
MGVIAIGFPRWHAPLLGNVRDHASVLSHLLVIGEGHRPNLSGSVAGSTIAVNEGSHIGGEGDGLRLQANHRKRKNKKKKVFHTIRF